MVGGGLGEPDQEDIDITEPRWRFLSIKVQEASKLGTLLQCRIKVKRPESRKKTFRLRYSTKESKGSKREE